MTLTLPARRAAIVFIAFIALHCIAHSVPFHPQLKSIKKELGLERDDKEALMAKYVAR